MSKQYDTPALDKNTQAEWVSRNVTALPSHKPTAKEQLNKPTGIRRVTDVQQYIDAGKSRGYVDKVKVSNLKQMAASTNYLIENGYGSLDEFEAALVNTTTFYNNLRTEIRDVESKIAEKKKLSTALANYRATVSIVKEYYTLKGKKQQRFRDEHDRDFTIFEGAKNILAELGVGKPLPSGKAVKAEIDALYKRKSDLPDTTPSRSSSTP